MEKKIVTKFALNPHTLCIEKLKISNYYEVIPNLPLNQSRKFIKRNTKIIKKIPLSSIDIQDLKSIRKSGKSGIIYKNGSSFYYGEIPRNSSISTHLLGNHRCSHIKEDCDKLYALL